MEKCEFAFEHQCMGVYVWDCLCSVDWGNKIQGQMSDFRVAEKYASYYPLSTSEPLSTQGFLCSKHAGGCSIFPYTVLSSVLYGFYHKILQLLSYCCVSWPHLSESVIEYHVPKRVVFKVQKAVIPLSSLVSALRLRQLCKPLVRRWKES